MNNHYYRVRLRKLKEIPGSSDLLSLCLSNWIEFILIRKVVCIWARKRVANWIYLGLPVKINDKFTFEKEIYFDRFMLEYKDQAIGINRTISKLRNEVTNYPQWKVNVYLKAWRKRKQSTKDCRLPEHWFGYYQSTRNHSRFLAKTSWF